MLSLLDWKSWQGHAVASHQDLTNAPPEVRVTYDVLRGSGYDSRYLRSPERRSQREL